MARTAIVLPLKPDLATFFDEVVMTQNVYAGLGTIDVSCGNADANKERIGNLCAQFTHYIRHAGAGITAKYSATDMRLPGAIEALTEVTDRVAQVTPSLAEATCAELANAVESFDGLVKAFRINSGIDLMNATRSSIELKPGVITADNMREVIAIRTTINERLLEIRRNAELALEEMCKPGAAAPANARLS